MYISFPLLPSFNTCEGVVAKRYHVTPVAVTDYLPVAVSSATLVVVPRQLMKAFGFFCFISQP